MSASRPQPGACTVDRTPAPSAQPGPSRVLVFDQATTLDGRQRARWFRSVGAVSGIFVGDVTAALMIGPGGFGRGFAALRGTPERVR